MKELFPDWRAKGVTVCLHEHQGGFAFNVESVMGLRDKCLEENVQIHSYVEVTGFELGDDDTVTAVETDKGTIAVGEQVVIAPGPWAKHFWGLLGLPMTIDIHTPSGDVARDQPMWTYWNLQEGEITVDPLMFDTADGGAPPVIHLDTDAPLYTDDGRLITDELWGIYYKRDRHGVQGGASPLTVDGDIELDPYPSTTNVDDEFPDMWCAALSHAMSRFEGCRPLYKQARSGGVGSFTADNFPVFDYLKPNVYGILDSNHGYKMIGVGKRGGEGALRGLCAALDPVPLRALRNRRSAPGLELTVPLVLGDSFSLSSGLRRASGRRWVVVEDPEDDRLAIAEVPPATHPATVRDQRLTLTEHRFARGEQHLHETGRDVHDLDPLCAKSGVARPPGDRRTRYTRSPVRGSSSSGTGRSLSAWRGSSRRASR